MSENLIAAIQTSSGDDIHANLNTCYGLLSRAVDDGARVCVLPECFGFMQRHRAQLHEHAEKYGQGPIQDFLAKTASDLDTWIVAGSLPLRSSSAGKVFNTLLVYNSEGEAVARYDKIFLFDVELSPSERYFESDYTASGDSILAVESPAGCIGLSICYDLRFPELYRALADQGAEILVVPSAFAVTTGADHWLPLLTARAIENTCYVVAPAQVGTHNGKRKTWGHTLIIDPWGRIVSELEDGQGVITGRIDRELLAKVRASLPSLSHRRPDLF